MSQLSPTQAYSKDVPYLLPRKTFSALGQYEQIAALALEEVGKLKIIDSPKGAMRGDSN